MAMQEITLDDMLKGAVGETEKEVYASAIGEEQQPLDETGDMSVEEMGDGLEGQHEPDEDDESDAEGEESDEGEESEGQDEEAEEDDEQPRDEKTGRFVKDEKEDGEVDSQAKGDRGRETHRVPVGELKSERERRQAVERERETERKAFNDQIAALNQRINDLAAGRIAQPQAQPKPQIVEDKAPDMLIDPQGYQQWQDRQFAARERKLQADFSMKIAQIRHGDTYDKAIAWVKGLDKSSPENQRTIASIEAQPDIGEALVSTYRRAEALREVGDDPAKYRERILAEALNDENFLAEVAKRVGGNRGEREATRGQNDGRPRQVFKLPKSLNSASGNGSSNQRIEDPELYNDSDKSVFAHAMR